MGPDHHNRCLRHTERGAILPRARAWCTRHFRVRAHTVGAQLHAHMALRLEGYDLDEAHKLIFECWTATKGASKALSRFDCQRIYGNGWEGYLGKTITHAGFNEYDEKKLFQKLKDATPESIKKNLKFIPRIASLEDDISDKRYASASNIMSDATYVDDKEEQTFAKENPITTGVGLTVPSAVAVQKAAGVPILKALGNIGKYPFKAAGSLPGAGYFAYDTIKRNLEEGESLPRSILDKEVGIELLLPEAFKKAGPLMLKAARLSTPLGAGITAAGVAKDYYDFVQRDLAEKEADPEAYKAKQDEQMGIAAADGGLISRQGFADGPEDPSKRKFMKIVSGLASLPIVGRFKDS